MNYQRPELRKMLAAEYVLGTLHGKARKRFERLLSHNQLLQKDVAEWEAKLGPLSTLKPVEPPPHVWKNIASRVRHIETPPEKLKQGLRWWQSLSLLTTVTTLLLAILLFIPSKDTTFEATYLVVISDQQTKPVWLVKADTSNNLLEVEALRVPPIANSQDYELWLLPSANSAPISMGLLPENGTVRVPLDVGTQLANAAGIAVSLEPAGGSTIGAPSGPVLYQSSIQTLL